MLDVKGNIDLKKISTLSLSFIGDGVFDLLVREYLVSLRDRPVGELNKEKVELVNCTAQSDAIKRIMDMLSDEEVEIYKRGRNTKVNSVSKHGTISDYHNATGLECLFGYLYLKGSNERLREIFNFIIKK